MMPVVTLCFREAGSTDPSTSYCPLGIHEESLVGNPVDGPLVELALRDGADALPAAYPVVMTNQGTIFPGVGLLLTVRNGATSEELGRVVFGQVNGMGNRAPGTLVITGAFRTMPDFGALISVSFMADCVPEFTDPNCTTPAPPTTSALPTTTPTPPTTATPTTLTTPTTSTLTTPTVSTTLALTDAETDSALAPPTEQTATTAEPVSTMTNVPGSDDATTQGTGNAGQSIVPIAAGAGGGVAVVLAIIIIIIVVVLVCVVGKRNKGSASDRYKGEYWMS
jgi:hypothetical protein